MSDFIRARSAEQKEQRMAEIKQATLEVFKQTPYPEITLTTIADHLGWSRPGLYKYASTKEEIFLALAQDEMDAYFGALLAAFPAGCALAAPVVAEVWAGIANAHQDYFRLGDLLFSIVETNVSLDRLIEFKRAYYEYRNALSARLAELLGIDADCGAWVMETVYHHAVGMVGSCASNPLVVQALEALGIDRGSRDFRDEMADFIGMCLEHCTA